MRNFDLSRQNPTKNLEMKKVIVLLSTYNGEKYVKEQIDSILNQTYRNIEIMVRDDGSKDNTVTILRTYEKKGKISLVCEENIGFMNSFFWLVNNAKHADYYSFADQDDVWLENKIELAINSLNTYNEKEPSLYFSDYDFYDENMNFIGHNKSLNYPLQIFYAITGKECALGFSSVINYTLKEMVKNNTPDVNDLYGHDFWFYLIALSTGRVFYDRQVTAKYRRHSKNVSVINRNFLKHQLWRIKCFLVNDDAKKISKSVKMCKDLYYNYMDKDTRALFDLFSYKEYNLSILVRRVFYFKRYRDTFFDEVAIRFIYLIGKM